MPLTAIKIENARPRQKPYKLADAEGLYLLVKPDGARYWRLKYRFAGKEKLLALGVYGKNKVTLSEARVARDEAKKVLRADKDPGAERRASELAKKHSAAHTFEAVAEEWLKKNRDSWTPTHAKRVKAYLKNNLYPDLGRRPISELADAPNELLAALQKIEARGAHDVAIRVCTKASEIFRYAMATGRAKHDPAVALRGALTPPIRSNFRRLDHSDLPEFLAKLDAYNGEPTTRLAIHLLALTFVRTGELRGAVWSEVDLDGAEWRIPAARMKSSREHIVPLSVQASAVLRELKKISGSSKYLFPHRTRRSDSRSTRAAPLTQARIRETETRESKNAI